MRILTPNQSRIDSGLQGVLGYRGDIPLFNPMTLPFNSTTLKRVRGRVWLQNVVDTAFKIVVQFSDDGVTWTDNPAELYGAAASSEGWNDFDDFVDIFDLSGVTPRLFVRFGLTALTGSANALKGATARLVLECSPVESATLPVQYQPIWSDDNPRFVHFTGAVPTEGIGELRVTSDVATSTGNGTVWPAYQVTNRPDDPGSWSAPVAMGSGWSTTGLHFGTTFSSVSFDERWVRFGSVFKSSNSIFRARRLAMRWDLR